MVASWPFLNLIELTFFRAHPSLKPHILFYSYGLVIWNSLPDIMHIKIIMASSWLNFKPDRVEIFSGHIPP